MGSRAGNAFFSRHTMCAELAWIAILAASPASSRAEGGSQAIAWGANSRAELGAGWKDTYEEAPVPVDGVEDVTAVAAGAEFSLALLSDGTVQASGGNEWGQLGDGTHLGTWGAMKPTVAVGGLADVSAIAAANAHGLALLANGTVMAWGNNNYGQLGNGKGGTEKATGQNETLPNAVEGLTEVTAIASGGGSNYALLSDHTVMAWGQNGAGQLGIGETGPERCTNELGVEVLCSTVPRPVVVSEPSAGGQAELEPLSGVASIAAGEDAGYAVLENGHVMSWGANDLGQLGSGGGLEHINPIPEEVKDDDDNALTGVAAVSGGAFDALALSKSGEVLGWGAAGNDQLGSVAHAEACNELACLKTARPVAGLEKVKATAVSAGEGYGLAVSGGSVYSFGKDNRGQLGQGAPAGGAPAAIDGIGPVSAVAAGNEHAIALLQPGVQAPAPPLSLQPGIGSLALGWTFSDEEYVVQCELLYRVESAGCHLGATVAKSERGGRAGEAKGRLQVKLGEDTHSLAFSGLQAEPYALIVKSMNRHRVEKKRLLIATPLG